MYPEVLNLLHNPGTDECCRALLFPCGLLRRLLLSHSCHLVSLLFGFLLLLLEELKHLEDLPEELINLYFHALSIQVQEGAVDPSGFKHN